MDGFDFSSIDFSTLLSSEQAGRAIFLAILLLATVTWVWRSVLRGPRRGGSSTAQAFMAWGLIFAGAIAVAGLWQDIQHSFDRNQILVVDDGTIEVPRGIDGHYYLTLVINDAPVHFVVDTGATGMVLTRRDALSAGLHPEDLAFWDVAHTANGTVRTAPVTLEAVSVGPFTDRNVKAYVNDGEMSTSLLGMEYLDRFDRLEISRGRMTLER